MIPAALLCIFPAVQSVCMAYPILVSGSQIRAEKELIYFFENLLFLLVKLLT